MTGKIIKIAEITLIALSWAIFCYIFAPVVMDFEVLTKVIYSIIVLGLSAWMIYGAWKRDMLRHLFGIVGLCVVILFCILQYLNRDIVTHDLDSYLKGDSEFMENARRVLPASVDFENCVDVQYTHHIDGLNGEYIELRIQYDEDDYEQMLQQWYDLYPIYEDHPFYKSFTLNGTDFDCINTKEYLSEDMYYSYVAVIGGNQDKNTVVLIYYIDDIASSISPEDLLESWYKKGFSPISEEN